MKRGGGRRYYRPEDINLLRGIRHLLYGEGYTIRGVQRILKGGQGAKFVQSVWQPGGAQLGRRAADDDSDGVLDDVDLANAPPPQEAVGARPRASGPAAGAPGRHRDGRRFAGRWPRRAPSGRARAGRAFRCVRCPPRNMPTQPTLGRLAREELKKLQAALNDLGECRKLLAAALNQQA